MVDHLACENAETKGNVQGSMVVNGFLPFFPIDIWIGNNWVFTSLKEPANFACQVDDILIGPL